MDKAKEIRPGTNIYVSGENVLTQLKDYLAPYKNPAIITGTKSYQVFKNYYTEVLDCPVFVYDGTASEEDSRRLALEIKKADVVIAIGGGKVLDTAKMAVEELNADLFIIPTLISNCAPFAPVMAVYNPNHSFKSIRYAEKCASLTLIDLNLLLATPKDYFIAGIGDTLAKWYEIEALTRNLPDDKKTAFISMGIASAKAIYSILMEDSESALQALESQTVNPAFGRIADTIIGLAGTVGGFAADYGRTAGAHAVHNALSYLPETHDKLHGAKVAYGILVQLAYTGDIDQIHAILPFYKKIQLPTSLNDLDVNTSNRENLMKVAEFAASSQESFKLINSNLTPQDVIDAMFKVEDITN